MKGGCLYPGRLQSSQLLKEQYYYTIGKGKKQIEHMEKRAVTTG